VNSIVAFMLHLVMLDIVHYQDEAGRLPFQKWMERLRDKLAKARIVARIDQLRKGNLGDARSVGEGVLELRVDVGAGYRAYCGRYGQHWIVLLCGGDKSSQAEDIARAKTYWTEWKRRQT
jgi:putative addiction module killer protein